MKAPVSPRDVVKHLARGGLSSIIIKVANGFLAYAMLLAVARTASAEQYGIFAVAFSVSITTAIIATLGQPWSVTRFWPQWSGQEQHDKASAMIRLSLYGVCGGLVSASAIMLLAGGVSPLLNWSWPFWVAAAAAALTFAFGFAEYAAAALRACGYVVKAMVPRDIVWRVLVCVFFGWSAWHGLSYRAETIVFMLSAILILAVSPQAIMLLRASRGARLSQITGAERKQITAYSLNMWTVTAIQMARGHAGVIIVSVFIGAEAAGAYFAADRTANMLAFILLAINLVSAPLISRYHHAGDKALVKLIVGLSGLASATAGLIGLVFFYFLGSEILAVFDRSYVAYVPIFLVLCLGQFINAATGSIGPLLVMSGHERIHLVLTSSISVVVLVLQVIGGYIWGPMGVAVANAAGTAFANLFGTVYAWRNLGIDTTGISLLFQRYTSLRILGGKE